MKKKLFHFIFIDYFDTLYIIRRGCISNLVCHTIGLIDIITPDFFIIQHKTLHVTFAQNPLHFINKGRQHIKGHLVLVVFIIYYLTES